jgi:hypothetical protein
VAGALAGRVDAEADRWLAAFSWKRFRG